MCVKSKNNKIKK